MTKRKSVREQKRKANEKKFFMYAIGITIVVLALMLYFYSSAL